MFLITEKLEAGSIDGTVVVHDFEYAIKRWFIQVWSFMEFRRPDLRDYHQQTRQTYIVAVRINDRPLVEKSVSISTSAANYLC